MIHMRKFEKDRAELSHDRFKNQFLVSIAYSPDDPESLDRNMKLIEAMNGDEDRLKQIRAAFYEWRALRNSIEDFLGNLPRRYGLVLSDLYESERKPVFEALEGISEFGRRFLDGKAKSPDLDSFWMSVDRVNEFFRYLGNDRTRYILDFDPALIEGSDDED